jgi:hypothetical protein
MSFIMIVYQVALTSGILISKPAGGYSAGDVVLYKNKYYGSLTSGNIYLPNEKIGLL